MEKDDCYFNRQGVCAILKKAHCGARCSFYETEEEYNERQLKYFRKHGVMPNEQKHN